MPAADRRAGSLSGPRALAGRLVSRLAAPRLDAVDVSRHQGIVDWAAVRAATAGTLVAMKATEGRTWVDPYFDRNRAHTAAAGFTHRLLYHWVSAGVPAPAQASHLLRTVETLRTGEGVLLDVEETGVTAALAAEIADLVERATGRPVAGYTGRYVDGGRVWLGSTFFTPGRARIFAAYTNEAHARSIAGGVAWDAWQFTSRATVPGVRTNVDGNRVDNLAAFDSVCGLTPTEDTMRYCLINVTGTSTVLIGQQDSVGLVFDVQWSGPGADQAVRDRLALLRAAKAPELQLAPADLRLCTLHGPVPYGDPTYVWSGREFFRTVD